MDNLDNFVSEAPVLFETRTEMTYEEYIKANKVIMAESKNAVNSKKYYIKLLLLCFIFSFIGFNIKYWITSLFTCIVIGVGFSILMEVTSYLVAMGNVKYSYKGLLTEHPERLRQRFLFYSDRIEFYTDRLRGKFYYNQLYKILETNSNFYIIVKQDAESMLTLNICKINCSQALMDFIRNLKPEKEK